VTDALVHITTSLCAHCKQSLPAELWRSGGRIVLRKRCPVHGPQEALVAGDADWYARTMALGALLTPPGEERRPVAQGCPFDCGPCQVHQQRVHLPIVPITSACNLDCPICYTHNKNEGAYHMSEAELGAILVALRQAAPERRIINLTGGEPTQHPQFERLVALCRQEGIQRITISTHGLRFLKDEWLLEELARLDARVILSFDSLSEQANAEMLGARLLASKLRVLELLGRYDIDTTLLPVVARGQNDHELGALVALALEREHVRSVELHTMTFTGQGGVGFDRAARLSPSDVLWELERQTAGVLRVSDFVPSPMAHPLCYQCTYLLRLDGGAWLPFPRFMEPADLRALLASGLYLEPGPEVELRLGDIINRLWTGEIACAQAERVLAALKNLVGKVFAADADPRQRLRRAERQTKAVYVHAHMDEETFDTDRIQQCCVGVRGAGGANIPSCAYNVLYRERDGRFMAEPQAPLVTLGRGRGGLSIAQKCGAPVPPALAARDERIDDGLR
jgi:uncharacterized radical SAM superfamily Fe-S cluster-containing enzyme